MTEKKRLADELYAMVGGECDSKIACHECPYFLVEDCATRRAVDKVIESGWRPTK